MKIKTDLFIKDLIERTQQNLQRAEELNLASLEELNKRDCSDSWSVLECIEHLNLYGDFYLPEIEMRIRKSKYKRRDEVFKSGLLGNYFAKMMLPGEKQIKMKTFKDKNPIGSNLDRNSIEKFIDQQKEVLLLLENARGVSLTKTKTAISISSFIKLRLGDTFRVLIYHNQRHMEQAEKAVRL